MTALKKLSQTTAKKMGESKVISNYFSDTFKNILLVALTSSVIVSQPSLAASKNDARVTGATTGVVLGALSGNVQTGIGGAAAGVLCAEIGSGKGSVAASMLCALGAAGWINHKVESAKLLEQQKAEELLALKNNNFKSNSEPYYFKYKTSGEDSGLYSHRSKDYEFMFKGIENDVYNVFEKYYDLPLDEIASTGLDKVCGSVAKDASKFKEISKKLDNAISSSKLTNDLARRIEYAGSEEEEISIRNEEIRLSRNNKAIIDGMRDREQRAKARYYETSFYCAKAIISAVKDNLINSSNVYAVKTLGDYNWVIKEMNLGIENELNVSGFNNVKNNARKLGYR